jgi:amidase
MADESLTRRTAHELAAMIKSRVVSPVEVLEAHLAAIARVNPKLNAIVTLAADRAKEHARAVETAVMRGDRLGVLAGLPIAIKDITPTAGIRTTFGSPLYKDYVPDQDAEAVGRLKAAGAIVVAKTNTPEFAAGANTVNALFGATRNPGTRHLARRAPPEGRRSRSRPGWFRLRRGPISAARSEFRRRSAASWEYARRPA